MDATARRKEHIMNIAGSQDTFDDGTILVEFAYHMGDEAELRARQR